MNVKFSVSLVVTSLILISCAAPVQKQERAGFISDYSNLQETSGKALSYDGPELGLYSKFYVAPGELLFEPGEGDSMINKADLEELLTYFRGEMIEQISRDDGYQVVNEPGEGVATIRWGLTAVDATIGALNISLATKITGAGLGGAAMEGEIIDSITGKQLAASVRWGSGSRVLRAGITKLGDAKIQADSWAKALRKRLDNAHGR